MENFCCHLKVETAANVLEQPKILETRSIQKHI